MNQDLGDLGHLLGGNEGLDLSTLKRVGAEAADGSHILGTQQRLVSQTNIQVGHFPKPDLSNFF